MCSIPSNHPFAVQSPEDVGDHPGRNKDTLKSVL